jgi:hypothetical protein
MEVNGQIHALATLSTFGTLWTLWRREKSLASSGKQTLTKL